ncbi:SIMPL domain-containing protein, partial [Listeria monocytogenes]
SENGTRMTRVLAALKKAGVAARDVRTANVSLSPQYRYADGQAPVVTGYQASNSVAVRFRDVAKSGAILDALVAEGANQIDGPS